MSKGRRAKFDHIFRDIYPEERNLIDKLIDETIFLEERMEELRKMPFIQVHPTNKAKQRPTPAAKQYKECSQSYMNAIRILVSTLHRVDSTAEDELLKGIKEFEL